MGAASCLLQALLYAAVPGVAQAEGPVTASGQAFTINAYAVEGNTLLSADAVRSKLESFTGAGRHFADVRLAVAALKQAYSDAGYPVVNVYPPTQVSEGGIITLRVVEGKIGKITIKNNRLYDEANIRASLPHLKEGDAPNVKAVVAAVAAANDNPAKQVAVNFEGGKKAGEVEASVNVTEDRVQKTFVSLDNTGAASTGIYRVALGWQHANLFNKDHMLVAQVGSGLDAIEKSYNISMGYRIPLYDYGLSVDLIAAYSDTSTGNTAVPGGNMTYTGKGTVLGVRVNQPLPSYGEYRHKLVYGLDYKDFDNRCTGNATATCGTVTSQPISVTYNGQYTNPQSYMLSGNIGWVSNIPGGVHGGDGDYALARGSAGNQWNTWKASAGLTYLLPEDWQFRSTLSGQYTQQRLIAAEQHGLGGMNSVRGYTERAASGDYGYNGSLEIYTPELAKYLSLSGSSSLRALAFYDFGRIEFNTPTSTEQGTPLASVGLGLRYNLGRELSARFDLGWAQEDLKSSARGIGRQKGDAYGNVAVSYSF